MKRLLRALSIALLLFLSMSLAALGGGDGSGGGQGNPLTLEACSVPDGSTDVPCDVEIVLTFSKNVVHFTVRDGNMQCFRLYDSAGNKVPIEVLMGDDQVDPSIKRIVTVAASGLTPGEAYTLLVSAAMTSKSGANMESDVSVHFTTASEREAAAPAAPTERNAKPVWIVSLAATLSTVILIVILVILRKRAS